MKSKGVVAIDASRCLAAQLAVQATEPILIQSGHYHLAWESRRDILELRYYSRLIFQTQGET